MLSLQRFCLQIGSDLLFFKAHWPEMCRFSLLWAWSLTKTWNWLSRSGCAQLLAFWEGPWLVRGLDARVQAVWSPGKSPGWGVRASVFLPQLSQLRRRCVHLTSPSLIFLYCQRYHFSGCLRVTLGITNTLASTWVPLLSPSWLARQAKVGTGRTLHFKVLVAQSCLTLSDPTDCSPPGSSVHGILQARILEWAAMPSSRGSPRARDQIRVSCIADR